MKLSKMEEKFEAYLQVQEIGAYNMFDPRARELAQELSGLDIDRADWLHIIKNYSELKEQHND